MSFNVTPHMPVIDTQVHSVCTHQRILPQIPLQYSLEDAEQCNVHMQRRIDTGVTRGEGRKKCLARKD